MERAASVSQRVPLRFGLGDVASWILLQVIDVVAACPEIQPAIDNYPRLRVGSRSLALGHGHDAIAAEARGIVLRLAHEQVAMFGICESPMGPLPDRLELRDALYRLTV